MKTAKSALIWITDILHKNKIPYMLSGGIAARIYGSKRPLADIDIDVHDTSIRKIFPLVSKYALKKPNRYEGKNWNILALSTKYKGQEIDFAGITTCKIFDKKIKKWVKIHSSLSRAVNKKVYGKTVSVINLNDLIAYKNILRRRVDLQDVKELTKLYPRKQH